MRGMNCSEENKMLMKPLDCIDQFRRNGELRRFLPLALLRSVKYLLLSQHASQSCLSKSRWCPLFAFAA